MIVHNSPISGIATANNKYIATAGYDNKVILWDSETNESLARGCHDHLVNQCAFNSDGSLLATSSSDYTCRLWSVPDLKIVSVLIGHTDDVEGVSFHPEKSIIATCSRDKRIIVWDFQGNQLAVFIGHTSDVISVEWIKGSDIIVSSSDDGTIKYWDFSQKKLLKNIEFEEVETDTIAISSTGIVFAGNDNGEIIVISDGVELSRVAAHDAGIKKIVYSDKLRKLVSLSYDRSFKVWSFNVNMVELISSSRFEEIIWPRSCAFLNDSEIAFATFGTTYAVFDMCSEKWNTSKVNPTGGINAALSVGGKTFHIGDSGDVFIDGSKHLSLGSLCNFLVAIEDMVLTGGQLGKIFDANTGEVYYQHRSPLNCGAPFYKDGHAYVIIGSYTGEGIVLKLNKDIGKFEFFNEILLHKNAIKGIGTNEKYIFSVCATGDAAMHSLHNFETALSFEKGHRKIANGCTSCGDLGFASISRDLSLRIWNSDGVDEFPTSHQNSIKCIASDPNGQNIVLGDYAGSISVFNTKSKSFIKMQKTSDFGISSIHYDQVSDQFIASSYNGNLYNISVN